MGTKQEIKPAKGKLAFLTPGMGAVATTLYAGVAAINKELSAPIGSYSQMGKIRLGKRSENRQSLVKDLVPLADLNDVVFGGCDIYNDNAYESARNAEVINPYLLEKVKDYPLMI